MIKFENQKQNNKNYLVAKDYTTRKAKILTFAKSLKLTPKGLKLVTTLLKLQKVAINNDFNKLLKQINLMLFKVNEIYRQTLIKNAEKIQLSYDGAKTFNFITCYNLIK